jgi:hypothetical protein
MKIFDIEEINICKDNKYYSHIEFEKIT